VKRILKHPGKTTDRNKLLPKFILKTAIVLLLTAWLAACSMVGPSKPPTPDVLKTDQLPQKVAIIPFVNRTSNPEAGKVIRKMFYNFFSSLNYFDIEPLAVDTRLREKNIYQKIMAGESVSPQKIGQFLGVDAIIIGEVLSLGKIYALLYADTEAGLKAQMIDCNSGEKIWELEHTIHMRKGDMPLSLTGLAAALVKTAVSHQKVSYTQAASELCMQMVGTIPNPTALTEPAPRIKGLVHNGAGKLLRPGDSLKVVILGETGQSARWSAPPLVERLSMREKEPGVYIGAYQVKPRDRLPYGRLVGHLQSKAGLESRWVDTLGAITIGDPTTLPAVISTDTTIAAEDGPYLIDQALLVLPGARLTIQPGTVIWFRRFGIVVKGEIHFLGTVENPVRFGGIGRDTWKGIILDHSQKDNRLVHCVVSGAQFGLRASSSKVAIHNSIFQDNEWGIVIEEGAAEIHNSLIRTSRKTGVSARKAGLLVNGSTISENTRGGILLEESQAKIEGNNVANNGEWEIKVRKGQSEVLAKHNWWGKDDPQPGIIGPVEIQPALTKPIDIYQTIPLDF
jgi:hypothetical protein